MGCRGKTPPEEGTREKAARLSLSSVLDGRARYLRGYTTHGLSS